MKTLAVHISRKMLALGIVAIIASGVLLASLNLALPFADHLRAPLEATLSRALGVDVTIGRMVARWRGGGPRILFQQVVLTDPKDPDQRIQVGELRLDLALIESLRLWRLRFEQILLRDTEFTLFNYHDGRSSISGLPRPGSGSGSALALFERLPNLLLEDARIHWRREAVGYRDLLLHVVHAQLRNAGERHQVDALVELPGRGDASLRLVFDFTGHLGRPGDVDGRIYARARGFPLGTVLGARLRTGARLQGDIDGELWAVLESSRVIRLDARVRSLDALLQWSPRDSRLRLHGDYAIVWERENSGAWRLDGRSLSRDNPALPQRLALSYRPQGGYRLYADRVGLAPLAFLALPVLAGRPAEWLLSAQPRGHLIEVRAYFGGGSDYRLVTRVEALEMKAVDKIPGISALDIGIEAAPGFIELHPHGVDTRLDTNGLFREPLRFAIGGRLRIHHDEQGIRLDSDDLHVGNQDLQTRTALSIALPREGAPLLDIVTRFHDGDARHASRYFPVRIMKPGLRNWLDHAFHGGRVVSGGFLFHGDPRHFPFDKQRDGRFQVLFDARDVSLHYLDGWPDLERANARVEFLNNQLNIRRGSARLRKIALSAVELDIDPLRHARAIRLRGRARGDLGEALALLRPHLKRQGHLDRIAPQGVAEADLQLKIPLGPPARRGRMLARAALHLAGNRLQVAGDGAGFEAIEGLLQVDQDGIEGRNLHAVWRGNPLRIDILRPAQGGTRIVAEGPVTARSLGPELAPLASGKTRVRAEMHLPATATAAPELHIESDLRGLRITLPPPFDKPRDTVRALTLQVEFEDEARLRLGLRWAHLLQVDGLFETGPVGRRPRWLRVHLGAGEAPLAMERPGIHIDGELAELDLDRWRAWLARPLPGDGEIALPSELEARLRVGRLSLSVGAWRNVAIKAQWQREPVTSWKLNLHGEGIQGRISRTGRRPLAIAFERLDLRRPTDARRITRDSGMRPGALPGFDLNIGRLALDAHALGSLRLRARHTRGGLRFDELSLGGEHTEIRGDGRWVARDKGQLSEVNLSLRLDRLGDFLAATGISDKVRDGRARVGLHLKWRGGPDDFALDRLRGDAGIRLAGARFIGVKPGVAKLLGLVSLDAIGRRLQLKFDDVLKAGLYVDEASGKLDIAAGRLNTRDFEIRGPMGRVTLDGWLELTPPQRMDLLATVVPEFGSTLTVAGAVAGGPVVGAALMVARNLLKKQVDEASTLLFRLHGTLDKPVTRVLTRASEPNSDVSDIHNYDEDANRR